MLISLRELRLSSPLLRMVALLLKGALVLTFASSAILQPLGWTLTLAGSPGLCLCLEHHPLVHHIHSSASSTSLSDSLASSTSLGLSGTDPLFFHHRFLSFLEQICMGHCCGL